MRRTLERAGYLVVEATDGVTAMAAVGGTTGVAPVDLVILDLHLPRLGGLAVLRGLRRESQVPVIILSGRADEADRVSGFEAGADDYVVKPFYPRELLARVRAVLRRAEPAPEPVDEDANLVHGDLVIDRRGREVTVGGRAVSITARGSTCWSTWRPRPGRCSPASSCSTRCGARRRSGRTRRPSPS